MILKMIVQYSKDRTARSDKTMENVGAIVE